MKEVTYLDDLSDTYTLVWASKEDVKDGIDPYENDKVLVFNSLERAIGAGWALLRVCDDVHAASIFKDHRSNLTDDDYTTEMVWEAEAWPEEDSEQEVIEFNSFGIYN